MSDTYSTPGVTCYLVTGSLVHHAFELATREEATAASIQLKEAGFVTNIEIIHDLSLEIPLIATTPNHEDTLNGPPANQQTESPQTGA